MALQYLEEERIIHLGDLSLSLLVYHSNIVSPLTGRMFSDLKPNNIVFAHKDREDLEVKIIDFGLAKDLAGETDIPISTCGTPEFTSPGQTHISGNYSPHSTHLTPWY